MRIDFFSRNLISEENSQLAGQAIKKMREKATIASLIRALAKSKHKCTISLAVSHFQDRKEQHDATVAISNFNYNETNEKKHRLLGGKVLIHYLEQFANMQLNTTMGKMVLEAFPKFNKKKFIEFRNHNDYIRAELALAKNSKVTVESAVDMIWKALNQVVHPNKVVFRIELKALDPYSDGRSAASMDAKGAYIEASYIGDTLGRSEALRAIKKVTGVDGFQDIVVSPSPGPTPQKSKAKSKGFLARIFS